ncbi:nucleolar protein 16 [Aplochiton taeniatus]
MGKRRKTFDYTRNRKKMKNQLKKKEAPRIECQQIRNAWNNTKSVAKNMQEMGLALDPNRALPIKNQRLVAVGEQRKEVQSTMVVKPYVVKLTVMEEEANLPGTHTKTLSADLIQYCQHMLREHGDNYKAMARDEKNYYQDTPKQIRRKVDQYKRLHPKAHAAFLSSLQTAATK